MSLKSVFCFHQLIVYKKLVLSKFSCFETQVVEHGGILALIIEGVRPFSEGVTERRSDRVERLVVHGI